MSTYTHAGYSTGPDGVRKFRVANDANRARVLEKNGHTEIEIQELPWAMDKTQAESHVQGGPVVSQPVAVKKRPTEMSREERDYHTRFWNNNFIQPALKRAVALEAV